MVGVSRLAPGGVHLRFLFGSYSVRCHNDTCQHERSRPRVMASSTTNPFWTFMRWLPGRKGLVFLFLSILKPHLNAQADGSPDDRWWTPVSEQWLLGKTWAI